MTQRLTLPQRRARETRQRLLEAASRVFARRGYGQATVEEIAGEAEISIGALYHHFAGKEDVFKAVLDKHMRSEFMELGALGPAASFREIIERFVAYQFEHMESDLESPDLSMEFWALAAREEWARRPVAEFHARACDVFARVLRIGQAAGVVRADLDVEAAAFLLLAVFEGVAVLGALDPDRLQLKGLKQSWADLIERFIQGDGGLDVQAFAGRVAELFQRASDEEAAGQDETRREGGAGDGA